MIFKIITQNINEILTYLMQTFTACPPGSFGQDCDKKCSNLSYGHLCSTKCQCPIEFCSPITGCSLGNISSFLSLVFFFKPSIDEF